MYSVQEKPEKLRRIKKRPSITDSNDTHSPSKPKSSGSPIRKDSAFEDQCSGVEEGQYQLPIPKIHGYLYLVMGRSKSVLFQKGSQLSKKKWCFIDSKGSSLSIYSSFSSHIKNESPSLTLPLGDFTASPTLLDGGDIVAFTLQSKTSDTLLIAYSPSGPKDIVSWTKSLISCECKFELKMQSNSSHVISK